MHMYLLSLMDDMDFKPYNQNNATAKEVITEDFFFLCIYGRPSVIFLYSMAKQNNVNYT